MRMFGLVSPGVPSTSGATLPLNVWTPLLGVMRWNGTGFTAELYQGDTVYTGTAAGGTGLWGNDTWAIFREANINRNNAVGWGNAVDVAEVAAWPGVLGAADWSQLRAGISPADVRHDLVPMHFPLRSDWSGTGPEMLREQAGHAQVWTDHPEVLMPRRRPLLGLFAVQALPPLTAESVVTLGPIVGLASATAALAGASSGTVAAPGTASTAALVASGSSSAIPAAPAGTGAAQATATGASAAALPAIAGLSAGSLALSADSAVLFAISGTATALNPYAPSLPPAGRTYAAALAGRSYTATLPARAYTVTLPPRSYS